MPRTKTTVSDEEKAQEALFKRAVGYSYVETTKERVLDREKNEYVFLVTKEVKKHVTPDVRALLFWLTNKMPNIWRQKQEDVILPMESEWFVHEDDKKKEHDDGK